MAKIKLPPYSNIDPMPPVGVYFCTTKEHLQALRKEYECELPILENRDAQASWIEHDTSGDGFGVIYIPMELKEKYERFKIDAIICHESVHIALDYFSWIGEKSPSSEEIAYTVQSIAQCCLNLYWKVEE